MFRIIYLSLYLISIAAAVIDLLWNGVQVRRKSYSVSHARKQWISQVTVIIILMLLPLGEIISIEDRSYQILVIVMVISAIAVLAWSKAILYKDVITVYSQDREYVDNLVQSKLQEHNVHFKKDKKGRMVIHNDALIEISGKRPKSGISISFNSYKKIPHYKEVFDGVINELENNQVDASKPALLIWLYAIILVLCSPLLICFVIK